MSALAVLRPPPIEARLAPLDWPAMGEALDGGGWAVAPGLLTAAECRGLAELYGCSELFRSRVVMAQHGFGRGEYQYFAYPLPPLVQALRTGFYPRLAPIANRWSEILGAEERYPAEHTDFLGQCHAAGQTRPTPLMLSYGRGDYNRLHQDRYGPLAFPIQVVILLSEPGRDFEGGAFVLAEQTPRIQTRVETPPLAQGDAIAFAVHHRPAAGKRGPYRASLRHGVSTVRAGARMTLGVIFHDAA